MNFCYLVVHFFKYKVFRKFQCFAFGHEPKCYLKPTTDEDERRYHEMIKDIGYAPRKFWRRKGMGYCAWCGEHTKEPVRLHK